ADLKIGVDLLYGTGRGYLDQLLKETGCEVLALHGKLDSFFGGLPPEPAEEQLAELTALVKKRRLHLGLAVDGDADRFGIVDADGTYINANQVVSLLTEHMMLTRSRQKRVARTLATTHMVDALAKRRGLKTVETPVGFKFIGQELAKGGCLIGGEESGGLSIVGHVPEKDGILACLLIAEMVAIRKKPLTNILKELYSQVGPFYTARIDFHLNKEEKQDVAVRLKSFSRKKTVLGERVARYVGLDGHKFIFTDGSWLMFRVSGTEPVVRCYLEAHARKKLRDLQALGHRMISK
ncbi:MAG: phosphoglucomutase/phosphomannomutase family protein, partial [Candidatus Omnitrophica bacterium]|nr:phosphoglucomutase/phosphomannomutase family protein [Candidatus Omnitrophota bacterium]